MKSNQIETEKKAIEILEKINRKNENHILIQQFITLKIIFKVLLKFVKIIWIIRLKRLKNKKFIQPQKQYIWPFFSRMFADSFTGAVCVQNLFWMYFFKTALSSMPHQKLGFYLQENLAWERIFLYFWRKIGHGKILV